MYCEVAMKNSYVKPNALRLTLAILLAMFTSVVMAGPAIAPPTLDKHVLILVASGLGGLPSLDLYANRVAAGLIEGGVDAQNIHIEYLDLTRHPEAEYRQKLIALFKSKYSTQKIDMVFCVAQPALNFLIKEGDWLAPGAVTLSVLAQIPAGSNISQRQFLLQSATEDFSGTMKMALALFPKTERVLLTQGNKEFGLAHLDAMNKQLAEWQGKLQFEDTQQLSIEEIEARVSSLPKNTIILGTPIYRDASGKLYAHINVIKRVAQASNAPVFTFYDTHMGLGTLGGNVINFKNDAAALANKGLDIFRGTLKLNERVTQLETSPTWMFDWQQLERWQLDSAALPADTIFLNKQATIWEEHKSIIITSMLIIAVLSGLIFMLLLLNRRLAQKKSEVSALNAELEARVTRRTHSLESANKQLARTQGELETALNTAKENESAALQSLRHQKFALDQHSIVSVTDIKGTIIYVNDLFCKISGYAAAELIGKNHRILNSGTHPTELFQDMYRSIAAGKTWHAEICNRNKQGNLYWVQSSMTPYIDQKTGKVVEYISIRTDITAQKQIQHEQNLLLAIIEAAPQFIATATPEGRVTHLNPAGRRMMGFSTEEDLGTTRIADYHPQWAGKMVLEQAIPTAMRTGTWVGETALTTRDGREIPIMQTIFCHRESDGKISQLSTIASDLSQRNQMEKEAIALREQVTQATKMESVGHLTAGIAHDFNNILGAMLGYAELSKMMLGNPLPGANEKIQHYQEMILTSGNRAKELILQMLTFSRISEKDPDKNNVPVIYLAPVLKEVTSLLRSTIPSTIELNCSIETDHAKARIHPVQLHQILLNLGVNARDAMGKYGKLDISLSEAHCEQMICASCKSAFTGNYLKITVKDNGSGIPQEVLNKIFDPFFTTKGVGKGTGMGLSVVHGIAHGANGHVQVETLMGKGTTISILLPLGSLSDPTNETINVATERKIPISGTRILLVDDEPAMADMTKEYLAANGAWVDSYTDPILALEAYKQSPHNYDLVITDETMPGLSGLHLAERILSMTPGKPVILCTGYSEHASPEIVAAAGLAGFFYKPVTMSELIHKISELIKTTP